MFFPPKPQLSKLLDLLWFWRQEQNSEFPKTFFGGHLFVFVEYLKKFRETKLRLQLNNVTQKLDFNVLWFRKRRAHQLLKAKKEEKKAHRGQKWVGRDERES